MNQFDKTYVVNRTAVAIAACEAPSDAPNTFYDISGILIVLRFRLNIFILGERFSRLRIDN